METVQKCMEFYMQIMNGIICTHFFFVITIKKLYINFLVI